MRITKNIIGKSEGDIGNSIEKLDGNYLEFMEKLNIIDTRVRGIFHVVSMIFNVFLPRDVDLKNDCVRQRTIFNIFVFEFIP